MPGVENALAGADLPAEVEIVWRPQVHQAQRDEKSQAQGVGHRNARHAASIAAQNVWVVVRFGIAVTAPAAQADRKPARRSQSMPRAKRRGSWASIKNFM